MHPLRPLSARRCTCQPTASRRCCNLAVLRNIGLLEPLGRSTCELKFYMVRVALHVVLPVCSPASDGPTSGVFRNTDLRQNATFSLVLRQIRLTVHATRPSVRVLVADRQQYMEHDTLHVLLQSARGSDKAFEQARYRKSARLQQRRQAGGPRQGARADDGGTVALCLPTPRLTQVSLLARPRPRSVLVCVPAPCLSSMAQPDLRLHPVGGRNLPDAAWEPTFSGCQAAACGSSMAAHRSSRRRPWWHGRCAPMPREGRARGPDGRGASNLLPSVGWPVHPDLLPSCGAFRACVSHLKSVCSMNSKIARTWVT